MLEMLKRVKKRFKKFVKLKIKYPTYYKLQSKRPIKNKIVFIENRFPDITNNFRLIHERLQKAAEFNIVDLFLMEVSVDKRIYDKKCMEMIRQVADAQYVFVNDSSNIVGCIPFRQETKVIQLWHGCGAYKKWGFSNEDLQFGANRRELLKYPYYADYSLVTVSSPEVIWAYKEAFNLSDGNDVVKATGVSRTDIFFDEIFIQKAYSHLYDMVPQAKKKKVILYAPTFRGNVANAKAPANLNQKIFCNNFRDEYIMIIKHHPSVKLRPTIEEGCENCIFDFTEEMTIEELICVSDICITDYSSIIFEYALFERPIIVYAYDIDNYLDWRGFYYDFESFVPGPIVKDNRELMECIKGINDYDLMKVKRFKEKFMSACDGKATDRILESIFGKM